MNHPAKFETNRTILTYLNYRNELTVTDEHTDRQTDGRTDRLWTDGLTLIIEKLRFKTRR